MCYNTLVRGMDVDESEEWRWPGRGADGEGMRLGKLRGKVDSHGCIIRGWAWLSSAVGMGTPPGKPGGVFLCRFRPNNHQY